MGLFNIFKKSKPDAAKNDQNSDAKSSSSKFCTSCGNKFKQSDLNNAGVCRACARKALIEKYIAERTSEIDALPRFEIQTNGVKTKNSETAFLNDLKYTKPTPKSKAEAFSNFVVIDTETTGLSSVKDEILEIAAIKVRDWEMVEVFHTLVKPQREHDHIATDVNGITLDMVSDSPFLYQVMPSLQEFISGYPILGQNLEFDLKFLCRKGLDVLSEKRKFFDTMKIAQSQLKKIKYKYDSDLESYEPNYDSNYDVYDYKLETLCDYYGIIRLDKHRAIGDCVDTAELFKKLVDEKIDS